jgi:hypothetical protein
VGRSGRKLKEVVNMSKEKVKETLQEPTGYVQCPVSGCGAIVKNIGWYIHFRNVHVDWITKRTWASSSPQPLQKG